jgi:hypothetical protein
MADIGNLVRTYLHPQRTTKRWNLYTVLGLDELIDDRTAVAAAVEAAIGSLKIADRTKNPESFEQIVKIVRQARATLLDEEKKAAYDKQLSALLRKADGEAVAAKAEESDSAKLQSLLPPGDPTTPFSMSDYLRAPIAESPQETVAEREFALSEFMREATKAVITSAAPTTAAASQPPLLNASSPSSRRTSNASKQIQAQIRRNRQRKNLIASATVLGVAFFIIGIAVWMYLKNTAAENARLASNPLPSMNAELLSNTGENENNDSEPSSKRMNLGFGNQKSTTPVGELPTMGSKTDDPPMSEPPTVDQSIKESPNSPMPSPSTQEPTASEPIPVMVPETAPPPEPSEADQKNWTETLTAARQAMIDRDFKTFDSLIEKAYKIPHREETETKLQRLDILGQAFSKGYMAFLNEIGKRKGAEDLAIGSTVTVAIVENTGTALIIREAGGNKAYKYDELPMGIALALANLDLTESPFDEAIRGALNLLMPQSKPVNKTQAQKFFDKAAEGDSKFSDLGEVLKDTH